MSQTAETCKVCELFLDTHGNKRHRWLFERFQVVLYLRSVGFRYKGRLQDHSTTEVVQQDIKTTHSHSKPSDYRGDQFISGAQMWIQILDANHIWAIQNVAGLSDVSEGFILPKYPLASSESGPLKCLTIQNDPATDMGIHWLREIGSDTGSETSFRVAQGWLQRCPASQHTRPRYDILQSSVLVVSECPSTDVDHAWTTEQVDPFLPPESLPSIIPTRLVDVSLGTEGGDALRLIVVGLRQLEYTTLSHFWGQLNNTIWLTTKENLPMRLESIESDELPATIRDSFIIAKKLGIRYLWIDTLRILQGDFEDWATEAAKMAGIYRGSILTIAASASMPSDQSCFNIDSTSRIQDSRSVVHADSVLSNGQTSRLYLFDCSPPDAYKEEVLDGLLSHRAWSYQEQVLLPRTLHYRASQLFWTCEHCVLSEDNFPRSNEDWIYPIFAAQHPIRDQLLIDMWYLGAVTEFSRRGITFQSDKLIVISALAKVTYLNKHVEYIAGLWKDKMIGGLMWRSDGPGNKTRNYRCPSWSWASQGSPVGFGLATGRQSIDLRKKDPKASYDDFVMPKVSEISIETDSVNPFGSVHGGSLALDTVAAMGLLLAGGLVSDLERKTTCTLSFLGGREGWDVNVYMDDVDAGKRPMQKVLCVLIGYTWANPVFLLLHPPDIQAKQHTRVGIAEFHKNQHTFRSGLKLRKLMYKMIDSMTKRRIIII